MAKSYAIGRSVMFQAHSQKRTSGIRSPSARNASTPSTTLGSSRRTPSSSRNSTDRKSTRLNSSHVKISYAVFCLKKKKTGEFRTKKGKPQRNNQDNNETKGYAS